MASNVNKMPTPLDKRLLRTLHINTTGISNAGVLANTDNKVNYQMPFSTDNSDPAYMNVDTATAGVSTPAYEIQARNKDGKLDDAVKAAKSITEKLVNDADKMYTGVASILNPYAYTRLYGSKGGEFLVDSISRRKYYEIDGDDSGHYAKNPTTSNIIKWAALDSLGRHNYQYQDFVFCKYWNKIPNNRLITLRRFASPTYDNLNFPVKDDQGAITMHPIATALTYFGEGTNNTLSEILKFTAGYGWEDAIGDVWDVAGQAPSMEKVEKATAWNKVLSQGVSTMGTVLGLFGENTGEGNPNFDFNAVKGLPPDPYSSGPYSNRILGPVNKISKVKKRDNKGLHFSMPGLTLKFDYVARPVGNINPKAALLDCLANFLTLGYSSAVWFGGSHRFMIDPTTYPFTDNKARQALWEGKLLGENGAARLLVKNYKEKMKEGLDNKTGVGNIFGTLADTAASLMGDLFKSMGLGGKNGIMGSVTNWLSGRGGSNEKAKSMATNIEQMVASSIQAKVGQVPYLDKMYSILTGEPTGDWHLVIGNPMNPIAEIGNLICKDISITFSDELGPDDFPIGFTATINLEHAMERDRDGIEAMFNKGAGRIYELPDKFYSSADGQTVVDDKTSEKGSTFNWTSVPKVPAKSTWSTKGSMDNGDIKTMEDAYKSIGKPGFVGNTLKMKNYLTNQDPNLIVHYIMPWQTKVVL